MSEVPQGSENGSRRDLRQSGSPLCFLKLSEVSIGKSHLYYFHIVIPAVAFTTHCDTSVATFITFLKISSDYTDAETVPQGLKEREEEEDSEFGVDRYWSPPANQTNTQCSFRITLVFNEH